MKKLMLLFFVFFVTVNSFAESLLVSDIDDTIKASHILNTWDALDDGKRVKNSFAGMSEFYNFLSAAIPDITFIYLSNAPKSVMYLPHSLFLKVNQFPAGSLILRTTYSTAQHKIENLRSLLRSKKYDQVIFVGDNGQKDTAIYDQISREFPQVKIQTYIHIVYDSQDQSEPGTPLLINQVGYVTSVDIAYDLSIKNIVDKKSAIDFSSQIIPLLISKPLDKSEESVTFAYWQKCKNYQSSLINFPALGIIDFENFTQARCHP